jgi:hypothetical protein
MSINQRTLKTDQSTKYEFNKVAAKVAEELDQSNGNSDTKKEGITTHKSNIRRVLKKNGKGK